jgi:hypothetical protein
MRRCLRAYVGVLGFGFGVLGFEFWVFGFGYFCVRSRSIAAPLTLPLPPPQVQLELVAAYQKRRAAGEKK